MGNQLRGVCARDKVITENVDSSLKDSEDIVVVVLQDYPSAEIGQPIYSMGEKLRVVAKEAYWWRVCSLQTKKENYIPNTHVAEVYHGWLFERLDRQKAEELLCLPGNREGSFLVRESSKEKGVYSLSLKHKIVKHYRIFRMENSWYYISPCLTFKCLEDMISHYSDIADGLSCALTSPCLSGTTPPSDAAPITPPVVMRCNFDWKKVDRTQMVDIEGDNMLSYGVRNSIAAYLSSFGSQHSAHTRTESRKKKSKSLFEISESWLANKDFDDDDF